MLRTALSTVVLSVAAIAQCTLTAPGTPVTVVADSWSSSQPIGFAFPFAGSTYTDLYVSDHSTVALNNGGVPAAPPSLAWLWNPSTANLISGPAMIAPYWSDHTEGLAGEIRIDNTSGAHCTITWFDHQTFTNQNPPFTLQLTLFPSGQMVICLDNRVDNRGSTFGALNAIFGVSPGTATLPSPLDISASPTTTDNTFFEEWTTTASGTPNPLFDIANTTITLVPTNPGWVVLREPLACASSTAYGTGCNGLALASTPPVVGGTWTLTTTGVPAISPIAINFLGTAQVAAGLPLPAIGIDAPGCSVYINNVLSSPAAPNAAGTAVLNLPLPNSATLKGFDLFAQSLALSLANPANLVTSNGIAASLGY
jgi:hypothetical protein